ncbi:hypothetical protein [Vibrio phage phiKT1028]|nr:hypothetical protein [Vibrio phage phiKT1028]
MEFTAFNVSITILTILAVLAFAVFTFNRKLDKNKAFKFKVVTERGMIKILATNEINPSLGFEAHFYPSGKNRRAEAEPRMQQYFGNRVYTFIGSGTESHHLNVNKLSEQFINMGLQDRLTASDDRVDFDMSLLKDLLFGFYYEELEEATNVYSPEMYNSIVEANREFARVNAGSFNLRGDEKPRVVNFKWIAQAA